MNRFVYSVVRIAPQLSTSESVNFAVVVGNDQLGDWSVRRVQDTNRARRFCGVNAMTAAHEFLADIEERVDATTFSNDADWLGITQPPDDQILSESLLDELSELRRGVVQLSAPVPVLADSSEDAIELLAPDLLVEPVTRVFNRMTKKRLLRDLKIAYRGAGVDDSFVVSRPELTVGKLGQFHSSTDLAVVTDRAVQLCNAWSFQIGDLEEVGRSVQAWGWNMRELRDHGGFLAEGDVKVPEDVQLQVIVAPNPSERAKRALEDARLVFEELQAVVVPYSDRQRVAESAVQLIS